MVDMLAKIERLADNMQMSVSAGCGSFPICQLRELLRWMNEDMVMRVEI